MCRQALYAPGSVHGAADRPYLNLTRRSGSGPGACPGKRVRAIAAPS
jgi:hypothetical protein